MNRNHYRMRIRPQRYQAMPVIDRRYPLVRRIDEITTRFEHAVSHIPRSDPPANMRRWRDGVEIALRRDNDRMERRIKRMRRIRKARNER